MSLADVAARVSAELDERRTRASYREDPVLWASEIAGVHLWSAQAEVARSVARGGSIAVKAGHGVGKSFLSGLLICWWIDTRYPDCFVASTAPSTSQIKAIVWREISIIRTMIEKRYKDGLIDHKLPGYVTSAPDPTWKTDEGVILGFGRKPPDRNDSGDAFQGIHARSGVLAIGDEAVGLTEELIDALGNITSTRNSARLLICNPTNPASYVGKLFKEKPANWAFHTISVLDSPNFTDEAAVTPPEVLEALTDESYVEAKRAEYGEGSAQWKSRIEGEFAWDMGFTLIRPEDIAKGLDCEIPVDPESRPVLGVDVSRSKAGDKNTVYSNTDNRLRFVDSWNEPNAMRTADRVHEHALALAATEVRIDGVGLGGPIADRLRELADGKYEVIEILGGDPSPDKHRWFNFRAWSWWALQDRLSQGLIDLDPADTDLHEQLMGVEIKRRTSGMDNILLESKSDLAKRGLHSPDHADAAVYASIDLEPWLNKLPVGAVISQDREEIPDWGFHDYLSRPGMPVW